MSVKVFQTNKAGKIEFTRCELEKLLNETYNEGYRDGEAHTKIPYWTWTSPSIVNIRPDYEVTCSDTSASKVARGNDIGRTVLTNSTSDKTNTCNATNKDVAKKFSVQTHSELKDGKMDVSAKVTTSDSPEKIYESKGMTYNMEDLEKTIDAILNGKVDLFTAKPTFTDTPFTNLAKELRGL